MRPVDCSGIWWLAEEPNETVAGTLVFNNKTGIMLRLYGTLGAPSLTLGDKNLDVIQGNVWDCPIGSRITLKNCQLAGLHLHSPGLVREDYRAERLFAGAHLSKEEDFRFNLLSLEFSGLPSWADDLTGFKLTTDAQPDAFLLRWSRPASISVKMKGGELTVGVEGIGKYRQRQESIVETVRILVKSDKPRSLEDLSTVYANPLQNFLTFATDHANSVLDLSVRTADSEDEVTVLGSRVFNDDSIAADLFPHRMIFSLRDIRDHATEVIERWLQMSEDFKDVLTSYFSLLYGPESLVDFKFLTVFQSLELYARKRLPADDSDPLSTRHLTQLVRHILEAHWGSVSELFDTGIEAVANEIVAYRNFVVHGLGPTGGGERFGEQLYWLTQRLAFVMKACFLTELSFPMSEQLNFFRRNQLYVHLVGMTAARIRH